MKPSELMGLAMQSRLQYGEENDCLVRAFSVVTRMNYEDAHALVELSGRKKGKGWYLVKAIRIAEQLGLNFKRIAFKSRFSVSTFAKLNPKGRYIVTHKGHAFPIIDGEIIDANPRKFVLEIYKFDE